MQLSNLVLPRGFSIIATLLALNAGFITFGLVAGISNDRSICRQTHTRLASRLVSYIETYKKRSWGFFRKTATRINYRWQDFIQAYNVEECCAGYLPQRRMPLICYPVCTSGCPHGDCSQPNVCTCFAGYRTMLMLGLSTCVPDCKGNNDDHEGCGIHGQCIAPSQCQCRTGYTMTVKKLHPADKLIYTLPCVPKCELECGIHGYCHEPNKCQCNAGYHSASLIPQGGIIKCLPICEKDCVNGICLYPNRCSCYPGYKQNLDKYFLCEPVCNNDCINGNCTEPNYCECHQGYKKNPIDPPQFCSAVCDPPCINANCTRPNHCQCHDGYKKNSNGPLEVCLPVCDPPCINATCTRPGECECQRGYEKRLEDPSHVCSPVCDPPCMNADCTRPNHCECYRGYKMDPKDPTKVCWPVCNPPCVNGTCTRPNDCTCQDGYGKDPKDPPQVCSPICDPPCIHADCTQPNHCDCHHSYKMNPESATEVCLPICNPPCVNATCTRPNFCECVDGYGKNPELPDHICSPACDPHCINSDCTGPNRCECHHGYEMNSSYPTEGCLPVCDPLCINAICYQPNHCKCHDGYEINPGDPSQVCTPVCDPPCSLNASCVSPNMCSCNVGYIIAATVTTTSLVVASEPLPSSLIYSTFQNITCQPICKPECTQNASCVAPNLCRCDLGYRSPAVSKQGPTPTQCLPVCEHDCVNAFCGYPNRCICFLGYTPSPVDDFVCEPFCQHDCINANCSRPNYCECYDGYEKAELAPAESHADLTITNNLCLPSCPEECLSASCIAPNQCLCYPGYVLTDSAIDPSQRSCQPLCEPSCPSGLECVAPNQCQSLSSDRHGINEFSTNLPDVPNIMENCPDNDNFSNVNGTCTCKDGWAGSRCDEPTFCIMIFIADNETDIQLSTVSSGAIKNNQMGKTVYDQSYSESVQVLDWQARTCNEECRISILSSKISGNVSSKIMHCHRRVLPNTTNDVKTTENQSLSSDEENKTIVCFIRTESECHVLSKEGLTFRGRIYGVYGATGLSLLLAVIAFVSVVIYIIRKKKRNAKLIPAVSMSNSIMTQWSDVPDCTHNTISENSSL